MVGDCIAQMANRKRDELTTARMDELLSTTHGTREYHRNVGCYKELNELHWMWRSEAAPINSTDT